MVGFVDELHTDTEGLYIPIGQMLDAHGTVVLPHGSYALAPIPGGIKIVRHGAWPAELQHAEEILVTVDVGVYVPTYSGIDEPESPR